MPTLEPWVKQWNNLNCLPVCHYQLEYTEQVRLQFLKDPPDALALELPSQLKDIFLKAINRLPEISVIFYQNDSNHTLYLPIEPVDPFVEAARSAIELDIPVHLVDINLEEAYPPFHDPVPDPYAIYKIGPAAYYQAFNSSWQEKMQTHPMDLQREKGMAFNLQNLIKKYKNPLFVCGMIHCQGVLDQLLRPQAMPLHKKHHPRLQIFNLHPSCLDEVLATFPFQNALYEIRRKGLPQEPDRDRFTIRKRFKIKSSPFMLLQKESATYDEKAAFDASLAWIARRIDFKETLDHPYGPIDRNRVLYFLFLEACRHFNEETGEQVKAWQKKVFWKFTRNYALIHGLLLPEFYQFLVGARASVDDNFCYTLWQLGNFYPWQAESANVPTIELKGEEIWLGTHKLRVRRWLPRKKSRLRELLRTTRKREKYKGEWLESFDGSTLCSYPPEDIVIEEYGNSLKKEWNHILQNEYNQSEPFSTSIQDGLDIRETIRKWPEGRIYVKKHNMSQQGAGAVIIIYEEDENNEKFPYKMTWLGEHEQESDMAFYATAPEDNIVGPGLCRCEYGGFLMTYPPRRLYDVWKDPDYRFFQDKSEILLAAGLDYSLEKNVVYVASKPPRSYMKTLAERLRRNIIYIPSGSLSPARLKKIRAFHILSGYDKREVAKDYIT